jgi:enhancing lycopene biosynthesis protein 2
MLKGAEHPDGILSFSDKLIMWDNKSKESAVNLSEHIKQFDRYITKSEKPVAIFIVIAPAFSEESAKECVRYTMNSDTLILLITAEELKTLTEQWCAKHKGDEVSFPLGNFKQNGRFNSSLVSL